MFRKQTIIIVEIYQEKYLWKFQKFTNYGILPNNNICKQLKNSCMDASNENNQKTHYYQNLKILSMQFWKIQN